MAKKKKQRLTFDESPAGFNDAFGGLDLGGLPSAPEPPLADEAPVTNPPGTVTLRRETAHRGGKAVVLLYDFPETMASSALDELARGLKQHCGTGGTVKHREIQIQGEKAPEVRAYLEKGGWRVRGV